MATPEQAEAFRKTAVELAALGGRIASGFLGKVGVRRKQDDTPVTEADLAVQDAILDELARRFPEHGILVEERVESPQRHADLGKSDYCWVVDPIDGTRNFSRGIGVYATSVALLERGVPVAGAIHDATVRTVYSAARGGGAFRGDALLPAIDRPPGSDSTVALSSFRHRRMPEAVRRWLDEYLLRSLGSLCLHLVWVAAGQVDAAYALECKPWDIAAAALIIEETGGVITDHAGRSLWPLDVASYDGGDMPILAGSPQMHARLLASLG